MKSERRSRPSPYLAYQFHLLVAATSPRLGDPWSHDIRFLSFWHSSGSDQGLMSFVYIIALITDRPVGPLCLHAVPLDFLSLLLQTM